MDQITKNRETWLNALRSGEYSQTKGSLYNGEAYCCLGVAHKVLFPDIQIPSRNANADSFNEHHGPCYANIKKALGVEDVSKFYRLNDSAGLSFTEIADEISADENYFWGVPKDEGK